jgi:hypothetical protein
VVDARSRSLNDTVAVITGASPASVRRPPARSWTPVPGSRSEPVARTASPELVGELGDDRAIAVAGDVRDSDHNEAFAGAPTSP